MSVWLCRQEPVKRPFYIRELDLHIHSSQELSYVIVNNPLLALEDFVDERLFAFVNEQLDMGFLSLKMERLKRAGESDSEVLCLFLQEADYCLPAEITAFRQKAVLYKKMPLPQYRKEQADYLFRIGQYRKALSVYHKIMEMPRDIHISDGFLGTIQGNMAASYARLLQYEQAAKAYEKSYFYAKDPAILKRLYFLTKIEAKLKLSDHVGALMAEAVNPEWEEEFETFHKQVLDSEERKQLSELFGRDSIRRLQGAAAMINDWKRKYRRMQSPS